MNDKLCRRLKQHDRNCGEKSRNDRKEKTGKEHIFYIIIVVLLHIILQLADANITNKVFKDFSSNYNTFFDEIQLL